MAGQSLKGRTLTEEHKRRISESHIGIKPSEETREKLRAAKLGKPLSEEHIKKLAVAHTGLKRTQETISKMSKARLGRINSDETREKISNANKGKHGGSKTESHKLAISKALTGNPKITRDNNHGWKGGSSFEPYCPKFNREFKERVRSFFGYKCVECGTPQNGTKLSVHHVNFNKDACCNTAVIPLFVALCPSCHSKTNFNRDYWETHFTEMINKYYDGKCYLTPIEASNYIFSPNLYPVPQPIDF